LNIRSSIKNNILCVFFFSYVFKTKKSKESKTLNNYDLMLEAIVANLKKSLVSSSTRNSKEGFKCISSLALKLSVMAEFKASDNNQCLAYWFKMQAKTIGLKQTTIVQQMNHVIGGGTWPNTHVH
jgi:hypothetical protein